jgi:L-asparaginase type I
VTGPAPRRVLILYTGGTIGMVGTARGYVPQPGTLEARLRSMPRFHVAGETELTLPASVWGPATRYAVREHDPLIDSSNTVPAHWAQLAQEIGAAWDDWDAFVVLHGTDTMAYTASALSFMLDGLSKPVILTGSQIPLDHLRNDAIDNLLGALILAAHYDLPEVALYFRDELHRGNRVRKIDASGFQAFTSPNHPPLVRVGVGVDVRWELVRRPTGAPLTVRAAPWPQVASVRLYPGLGADLLDRFLQLPLQGLVLETYGSGNAPDDQPALHRVLSRAAADGIVLVNVTQCLHGRVSDDYAAGRALRDCGVVPGADMTPEAALTKLGWLLSRGLPADDVRAQMTLDLRGELTAAVEAGRRTWRA